MSASTVVMKESVQEAISSSVKFLRFQHRVQNSDVRNPARLKEPDGRARVLQRGRRTML